MRVDLKGIAKAAAKGRTYYYAWRGGPRLSGEPGSPEFIASYNAVDRTALTRATIATLNKTEGRT